jgi:hypothetical protein
VFLIGNERCAQSASASAVSIAVISRSSWSRSEADLSGASGGRRKLKALYPNGKHVEELPYPRAKSHRQVPVSIRVMLAGRAQAIGAINDTAAVA